MSCTSAGNCAVGGVYADTLLTSQGFTVLETNGVWGNATEPPGLAALNKGGFANVSEVSCAPRGGSCAAVGNYTDIGENSQGFIAVEKNGVWGNAAEPPGLAALNGQSRGGNAEVNSVSCTSPGECAAVGDYGDPYGVGFVTTETKGVWGKVTDLGLTGRIADASSVSCASPGDCAAGGSYSNASGSTDQAWVAAERHGRWVSQIEVPGLGALNSGGGAYVTSVSCAPAGGCATTGVYTGARGREQGFVVSES